MSDTESRTRYRPSAILSRKSLSRVLAGRLETPKSLIGTFMSCRQSQSTRTPALGSKRLLVLKTKGLQLKGNEDTERRLMDLLSEYHKTAIASGEFNIKDNLNKTITLTMLMEDDWREKYKEVKGKISVVA